MKYKLLSFVCIVSAISFPAQKQMLDFAGVNYSHNTLKDHEINGKSSEVVAFINFPILKKEKDLVGGRLTFHHSATSNVDSNFNQTLSGLDANIFWEKKLSDNSKLQVLAMAGIFSDYEDLSWEDFRYSMGGQYRVELGEKFSTGVGLAYARQFSGHQINPFVSINYKINEKWELSGLLPIKPKLTYHISKNLKWINELSGKVESYRLSENQFQNSIIEYSGWHAMTGLDIFLKKHHHLNIGVGYALRQRMRLYEDADTNNWKIFTFNLSEKSKPVSEIVFSGFKWTVGYSFQF